MHFNHLDISSQHIANGDWWVGWGKGYGASLCYFKMLFLKVYVCIDRRLWWFGEYFFVIPYHQKSCLGTPVFNSIHCFPPRGLECNECSFILSKYYCLRLTITVQLMHKCCTAAMRNKRWVPPKNECMYFTTLRIYNTDPLCVLRYTRLHWLQTEQWAFLYIWGEMTVISRVEHYELAFLLFFMQQ